MTAITIHRKRRAARIGIFAGLRRSLLAAALIAAALPVSHFLIGWYVTGIPQVQASTSAPSAYGGLRIENANAQETVAVRSAMAALRYKFDERDFKISLEDDWTFTRSQVAGQYSTTGEVKVQRPLVDLGGPAMSWTLAHEMGHYVDDNFLSDEARAEFMKMRGIPDVIGWDGAGRQWTERPIEDFADSFAAMAQHKPGRDTKTAYGPIKDPKAFEALLADSGVRPGRQPALEDWRVVLSRETALYRAFLSQPNVAYPIAVIAGVYVLFGMLSRSRRAYRRMPRPV